MKEELEKVKQQQGAENESLLKRLDVQTKKSEALAQEIADKEGEIQLLKKKHVVTLKASLVYYIIGIKCNLLFMSFTKL